MAREFMVGTLDDTPLLMIKVDGEKYLVDLGKKVVFFDTSGIPKVLDETIIVKVLKAAETTT
ncbi:hypothetical protein D3C86_1412150 [compost metagenome]